MDKNSFTPVTRRDYAVEQIVEELRCKPESQGIDSSRPHYSPGVDSASDRNEYQEYYLGGGEGKFGRCVGLTTLPNSCAHCLEIWEPQPPGTLRPCPCL